MTRVRNMGGILQEVNAENGYGWDIRRDIHDQLITNGREESDRECVEKHRRDFVIEFLLGD